MEGRELLIRMGQYADAQMPIVACELFTSLPGAGLSPEAPPGAAQWQPGPTPALTNEQRGPAVPRES
jgi:hypothetical protein